MERNNDNCMGSKLNYNAQMVKQNAVETGCNEGHELDSKVKKQKQ